MMTILILLNTDNKSSDKYIVYLKKILYGKKFLLQNFTVLFYSIFTYSILQKCTLKNKDA